MTGRDAFAHDNQRYLARELARIKRALGANDANEPVDVAEEAFAESFEPALVSLARAFGLSAFERDVVLLCAGVEMSAEIAPLCAEAQRQPARRYATFGLALGLLDAPHWSALTPVGPLRRFRLIELEDASALSTGRIRIDERVLHYVAGINYLDPRLAPLLRRREPGGLVAPSHRDTARAIVAAAVDASRRTVVLNGDDPDGQRDVALEVTRALGLELHELCASELPKAPAELDALSLLWQREALLLGSALLVDCGDDGVQAVGALLERLPGLVFAIARDAPAAGPRLRFEVSRPRASEQRALWRTALGDAANRLDGSLDAVSSQFRLSAQAIAGAAEGLRESLPRSERPDSLFWRTCRGVCRTKLDDLAQGIETVARWDDLVLPDAQKALLRQIAVHVGEQLRVYEEWGFARRGTRGLGMSALFAGESGTGKTLAAEVLAHELQLELYRIDLSSVVSKFIGETEKNLRRVFDAAEDGGAILLFDEADALFGKRSEVKDSHDRYANIEVSYLLQRMEAYRGLAILTTNSRSALDAAFQRRLRFIVPFPFPDARERELIWRGVFPSETPLAALDYGRLAKLGMSGGNIRSIALNAAFLAASERAAVGMAHLLQAARHEATKRERSLSDAETRGWV
jgi:hypothetical protein